MLGWKDSVQVTVQQRTLGPASPIGSRVEGAGDDGNDELVMKGAV